MCTKMVDAWVLEMIVQPGSHVKTTLYKLKAVHSGIIRKDYIQDGYAVKISHSD